MKFMTFDLGDPLKYSKSDTKLEDRLRSLGKLVQAKKPEYLALQNVTKEILEKIKKSPWGARYNVNQPPYVYENRMKPKVALLSTYPSEDSITINYHESPTARALQKGYYVVRDRMNKPFVICVATTNLESELKATDLREKQLNEGMLSMVEADEAFLMGNFHLDSDIDGQVHLRGGWMDAWLQVPGNTDSNGYTYDPRNNPLIKNDPFGPGRPTRFFFKTRTYELDSIEIVGVDANISMHYGLLAQLSLMDTLKPKHDQDILSAIFEKDPQLVGATPQ